MENWARANSVRTENGLQIPWTGVPVRVVAEGYTGTDRAGRTDERTDGRHAMIPVARLSRVRRVSQFISHVGVNLQEDKLGKVENVLFGPRRGSRRRGGGFLGRVPGYGR